jgi:hypothetical protein
MQAQIAEELRRLLPHLEELTGLQSRWNGIVILVSDADYLGLKPFSCKIRLDAALAQQPTRWSTLIHELLHSCSAGYKRDDFQKLRGWEEGVVEQLQRLLRPELLMRLKVDLAPDVFALMEATHHFNPYIEALEEIRLALKGEGVPDAPREFYTNLLRTPMGERPGYILGLGYQRIALPRAPFVRAFSAANALLTRKLL